MHSLLYTAVLAALIAMAAAGAECAVYERELAMPDDFSGGICERVYFSSEMGGLALINGASCVPYLWVPSPDAGTVSKIDARTGRELGRYYMGPKDDPWWPVSVASDYEGNAWVACASPGSGAKIVRILATPDAKARLDGSIVTGGDHNADGCIIPAEMVPWGQDEMVGPVIQVGTEKSVPTCAVFDGNGYLWVGLWGEQCMAKVDVSQGVELSRVLVAGRPSSAAVGPRGSLWVLSRDASTLSEVNPIVGVLSAYHELPGLSPESMCVDAEGIIWMGSHLGLVRFDTQTRTYTRKETNCGEGLAGVAVDTTGDIWAACPNMNNVIRFNREDLSEIAVVAVGKSPGGVALDEDGCIWVLNEASATASRIDPRKDERTVSAHTGPRPASSTCFSTSTVKQGISPNGSWRVVMDSRLRGAGWGRLSWETGGVGEVKLQVRSADSPDELDPQRWTPVRNGEPFEVPNGRYLEIKVDMTAGGGASPVLKRMLVQGRNLPPDVSRATPSSARLWQADRSFERIHITGITDPEGDPYTIVITGVTQDEPVEGLNENDKGSDAEGIGGSSVLLRGECDPGDDTAPGNGRVYVVKFTATDIYGASSSGRVEVSVPRTASPQDFAVDDGQKYESVKKDGPSLVAKS